MGSDLLAKWCGHASPFLMWVKHVKCQSHVTGWAANFIQKFKVQSNLLKESPKLKINLQRQDTRDD